MCSFNVPHLIECTLLLLLLLLQLPIIYTLIYTNTHTQTQAADTLISSLSPELIGLSQTDRRDD